MRVKTLGVYARVVGYYSKVENWNKGKVQEWKDRANVEIKGAAIEQKAA